MSSQTLLGAIHRSFFKLGGIALRHGRPEIAARLQHDWPAFSMVPERMRSQNPTLPAKAHRWLPTLSQYVLTNAAVAILLSACSHVGRDPVVQAAVVPAPRQDQSRAVSDWALLDGKNIPIRMRLPFAPEWKRQDIGDVLRLEHADESCQIAVRLWSTSRIATVEQCFDELSLKDPRVQTARNHFRVGASTAEAGAISREAFDPGADAHGWLVAMVRKSSGSHIKGSVVGVAAGIGRCVSVVAETSSESASGEQQVGERLAWLVEGVAKSITVRSVGQRIN